MTDPIRIIVADDHALFREGLKLLLELHESCAVVAETGSAEAVAGLVEAHGCDVLLLDLQMDRSTLLDVRQLSQRTKVLVVTASEIPSQAIAALRAGARGVLYKRFAADTLQDAITAVAAGEMWTPPELQPHLAAELRGERILSLREEEVVRCVALGMRNAEVARQLFISEPTVKAHLNTVFQKLGLRDRVQLTRYAIRAGMIGPDEPAGTAPTPAPTKVGARKPTNAR